MFHSGRKHASLSTCRPIQGLPAISAAEKQRLLAEADFHLKALAWRSDARTARRDFWMEVAVIVLIGVEIILSLVFGFLAIRDARDQARILGHMDTGTAETAATMQTVRDELKSFAADQAKTREILQKQEDARLAQLSKKPRLALYIGHVRLDKPHGPLKPSQETDTNVTYDFVLQNVGDATANKLYLRAYYRQTPG